MRAFRFVVWAVVLVACGGCASSPLDRVTVIGASVSAGVGAWVEDGKERRAVDLADALVAAGAVKGESGPRVGVVNSHADPMYFMNAGAAGDKQLKEALAEAPGCIVALDDLFWHVYGPAKSDPARLARLEKRLKSLEAVKVPLVIGDVPDMSSAYPGMLTKAQIAPEAVRVEANARIRAWAAGRPNVALVGLSDVVAGAKAGRVTIGNLELLGGDAGALIGPDRLHASADGLAAVAILVLDGVEQIRSRQEKGARRPLPALQAVEKRLRPRPRESGSWMELLNSAMELKQADDSSQKIGIELDQAAEFAKAGRAQRVAEVLPELWMRELKSRTMLPMGQYVREEAYKACQKAGVDVKSKMVPVRDSLVQSWRAGGAGTVLAAEIMVLDRLLGEPRRDLEILRDGVVVESSAVKGDTPALAAAWQMLNETREEELGGLAVAFANPTGAVRREVEAYKALAKNAGKPGSFISENDAQERRARAMRQVSLLTMALDRAGRAEDAGAVRELVEKELGERPGDPGPREMWYAEKLMEPVAFRAAYLRALRKHLGLEVGPGVDLLPAWDSVYASTAGRIGDRATSDEALRLVREWRAGLSDVAAKRRGINFQLQLEDALGMEPTVIDELVAIRADAENRKSTDHLAHKVISVAATNGGAAKAVGLFDDYREWPERVRKELGQLEKDTGGSSWISNESIKYMRVKEKEKELRSAAVCLKAAGRVEEAAVLVKKAEEIRWKEPGWARK